MNILFAGIGGVGGYFGGVLAHHYEESDVVNISFLARGKHLKKIQSEGLQIKHNESTRIAKPFHASADPSHLGWMDVVFLSTKSYDVAATAKMLAPCISSHTKIITLLNGVDSLGIIRDIYPNNEVLNGCVYILSKLDGPGVIHNFGQVQKMFFGRDHQDIADLKPLEQIVLDAGLDVVLTDAILETTWTKFVFISGVGSCTSYFDEVLGAIFEADEKKQVLVNLLEEVTKVGKALGVKLDDNVVEITLGRLSKLPFDTTSSMQRDFRNGGKTEVDSQTGFVLMKGKEMGVELPTYEMVYSSLKEREGH